MSIDKFYKNSIVLTISNSTMGVLRFIFSIILSKELGAEGIGLYSLIMPVYDVFCCLVCGGLTTAISKEAAVYHEKRDYNNLRRCIRTCIFFDFIWSVFIAVSVFVCSPFMSKYIIMDKRALYSIEIICPALIFIALSSIIKGYYYGISKVNVPAIIDIFEKGLRIAIVVFIIKVLSVRDITTGVTATYLALAFGELLSFVLLYLFYKAEKNPYPSSNYKPERRSQMLFNILVVSLPLCINGFLSTILSTISTLIMPRRLIFAGFNYTTALSMIGKFTGMALSITNFPIIVIVSMSTVLVPDISQSISKKDYYSVEKRIREVLGISLILGIATTIVCICIPNELGQLFYSRNDLASYIAFTSLSATFIYISCSTFSIMSGLNLQNEVLKNSLIISVEEVILLFILTGIKSINIYGYGISLIITCITSIIINMHDINKNTAINISFTNVFIYLLIGIFSYFVLMIIKGIFPFSSNSISSIIIIILGFVIPFLLSAKFKKL